MAGFLTVADLARAEIDEGCVKYSTWRKTPSVVTPNGTWFDLSMSPGNPVPQYYAAAPLVAIKLAQSTDGGLFHGGNVFPKTKHIRNVLALSASATPLPMSMRLLDYLMFYPFIDEGETSEQTLTTNIALPRYPTGDGVQVMAVSLAARTGGQRFFINYTNSEGVVGRISKTVLQNGLAVNGSIVTSAQTPANNAVGPFIPLQDGDSGVRSIQSVTMLGPDIGLFALVLVKPLGQMQIRGIDAPVEVDYFQNFSQCPRVIDDAYLNFIVCPVGSLSAAAIHGDIKFVWN